ncbi:MAG: class I SAM-dependent methyltransferase [Gammaproteobacteria bacterium]|nr:class I SAM-dependent methyltransferase [Gammaproteobacteria bacterium]
MVENNPDAEVDGKGPVACSFCDGSSMNQIIDFGIVALAGGFLKPEKFDQELKYPLRVYFCHDCFAVQVIDKVNPQVLFEDYFYFSSSIKTLSDHFKSYAAEVTSRFLVPESSSVLEFGCNDGILLRPLADHNIRTLIGVDPASNVVSSIDDPRINIVNNFFNEETSRHIVDEYGKLDMVLANNVYAHIPDIQGVTRAVANVLDDDGVFIFEVHYLGKVIDEMQYDMIYHEHLYYYSLLSAMKHFELYDMTVFDVKPVPIHGGSMRFYVCKNTGKYATSVSLNVMALQQQELTRGFHLITTYNSFAGNVAKQKKQLLGLLDRLKSEGHSIAGYGASGRANTMIQYCEIDHRLLDFMIDDAPAKSGFYTPGSHFLIYPGSVLNESNAPDYLLIFAWSFYEEIARRNVKYIENGGKMILPLPSARIVQ